MAYPSNIAAVQIPEAAVQEIQAYTKTHCSNERQKSLRKHPWWISLRRYRREKPLFTVWFTYNDYIQSANSKVESSAAVLRGRVDLCQQKDTRKHR